jgi:hypothetical protein
MIASASHPADIAERPGRSGDAAEFVARAQIGQHRIDEGGGTFHADEADAKGNQDGEQTGGVSGTAHQSPPAPAT